MFQLTHHEPAIVHAAVAVGSMHLSLRRNVSAGTEATMRDQSYSFAITQYLKSLRILRTRIEACHGTERAEIALIICILFVCFEMLQGNNRAAMTHLETGLRILTSQTQGHDGKAEQRASSYCTSEITALFARLDLDTIPFGERSLDGALVSPCMDIVPSTGLFSWIENMPTRLDSLEDARTYLDTLTNAAYHLSCDLLNSCQHPGLADMDFAKRRCYQSSMSRTCKHSDELTTRWIALKRGLALWWSAYQHVRSTSSEKSQLPRAQTYLESRFLTVHFQVLTAFNRDEESCDRFNAAFQHMVTQASHIIMGHAQDARLDFAMESGLIPALYLVAVKCREPATRRQAIALLKSGRYREGMWNGGLVGIFAEQIARLEEQASSTLASPTRASDILESSRFHTVIPTGSAIPGHGRLVCARFQPETEGELCISEIDFPLLQNHT